MPDPLVPAGATAGAPEAAPQADARSAFAIAADLVLAFEGAQSDHPTDAGGLTKWGIASRWYPDVRRADFSREDALAIYARDYWQRCACDQWPLWLALVVFDAAVQHGPADAIRMVQRACGVPADGIVGPQTLAAGRAATPDTLGRLLDARCAHYLDQSRAEWAAFGRGWTRRLLAVTHAALTHLTRTLTPRTEATL